MRTFVSERSLLRGARREARPGAVVLPASARSGPVPSWPVEATRRPVGIDPNAPDGASMTEQEVRFFSGYGTDPHNPFAAAGHDPLG